MCGSGWSLPVGRWQRIGGKRLPNDRSSPLACSQNRNSTARSCENGDRKSGVCAWINYKRKTRSRRGCGLRCDFAGVGSVADVREREAGFLTTNRRIVVSERGLLQMRVICLDAEIAFHVYGAVRL